MTIQIDPKSTPADTWIWWVPVDGESGFEVLDPKGRVAMAQIGEKTVRRKYQL